MKELFWASALLVAYTYIGYAGVLCLLAKIRPRPVNKRAVWPTVSIVMAVHNAAGSLGAKLKNLAELAYPKDKLEIIVASDGSTDGTAEILHSASRVKSVLCPRVGKAEALNRALAVATHDVVVFTDVRQKIEGDAIGELVANFADQAVGCVSGELMFRPAGANGNGAGASAYWRIEKLVRKLESCSGSVVGATGALYAARRWMIPPLPEGTLLDDVYIPLAVARSGGRVVFDGSARTWDDEPPAPELEFRRKVRTLAGNYQLLQLSPWLMTATNPLRFRFICHKLLRLIVPFLLIIVLVCSIALLRSAFYAALMVAQLAFYVIALAGIRGWRNPLASAAAGFCVLNTAAAAALFRFWRYRHNPVLLWKAGYPAASDAGSATQTAQAQVTEPEATTRAARHA